MQSPPPLPDSETIRRTAAEVIRRPDYRLEPVREVDLSLLEWFLEFLAWALSPFRGLWEYLFAISPVLAWVVVVGLVILLLALVAHILYTFWAAFQGRRVRAFEIAAAQETLDPAGLEQRADEAVAREDYILAVRLLFRASLLRLARAENRTIRQGITNREYLRRYRGTQVFDSLKLFVETIDNKWYGRDVCRADDYEACLQAHQQIRRKAEELAAERTTAATTSATPHANSATAHP